MGLLPNKEFLSELTSLLETSSKSESSLYFTQKRYNPPDVVEGKTTSQDAEIEVKKDQNDYKILFRVTNGEGTKRSPEKKKIKYSTIIEPENLDKFWKDYSTVMKSGISGLKKKEKKKNKKKKKGVQK